VRLLVAALALALAALVGARFGYRTRASSLGARLFFASGSHFLLLGLLLGPHVAGVLSEELFLSLTPFVALGLGWIGLTFGFQFDRALLRNFSTREHAVAFGQAAVALALLTAFGLAVLAADGSWRQATPLVLAAAAAGCIASPTGIAMVFSAGRVRGPVSRLLSVAGSLDGAVGIAALAFVFAVFRAPAADMAAGPLRWVLTSALLGVLFGWLFLSLTRGKPAPEELVLFLIGMALLLAGANMTLAASTLFGSFLTGAVITNMTTGAGHRRIYVALKAWEKPLHIIFLLLAGSLLPMPDWRIALLLAVFLLARVISKACGGLLAGLVLPPGTGCRRFGLGLLSQGGVSIAMAVSVYLTFLAAPVDRHVLDTFFAVVVLAVMANEFLGPNALVKVLRVAGEIDVSITAGGGNDSGPGVVETGGPAENR
jgi:hypothetical protein